jgi:hypothetical protein
MPQQKSLVASALRGIGSYPSELHPLHMPPRVKQITQTLISMEGWNCELAGVSASFFS